MYAGLDGCNKGWMSCVEVEGNISFQWFSSLREFVDAHPSISLIGIDMVIGLPTKAVKGGRPSEKMARSLLKKQGSSVFSAPCRKAVYATSYQDALQQSRASSPDRVGLSIQTYNIFPLIRDVDTYLQTDSTMQSKIFEVHPELSFWQMNQQQPVGSKHSKEGFALRMQLLKQENLLPTKTVRLTKDHVDSAACLWSVKRIGKGTANRVPKELIQDAVGLPMQIHW